MNTIYRSYTVGELQSQYSAREAVPDHLEIFEHWQKASERYRIQARAVFNLSYGDSERQKLDLFLPDESVKKPPLFIFIHGGYWQAMSKDYFSFIAREVNKLNVSVAILNYDLCPDVTLDELTNQIRRSVVWLARHAGDYQIDAEQLHLCGHSAGGHLTAALMTTDWKNFAPEFNSSVIRSGFSISGVFDLEPLIYTGINNALGLDLLSARRNSPVLISPKLTSPFTLIVGGDEPEEFHRQSQHLTHEWKKHKITVEYHSLDGLNHFTLINEFEHPASLILKHVMRLMDLKK